MKRIQLLVVLLITVVGFSYAQPGQGQRRSPEEMEKRMVEQLGLDAAQQDKLHEINKKYQAKSEKMREDMKNATDEDARKALFPKMRETMKNRNVEIRSMLNAEQAEKFDEMQKQREERMKKRRSPDQRGGNVRPGK
jgi:Spy/CpxP family protein refolding chaperone